MKIKTPERLILARLRRKRYTGRDLFRNAEEAIRAYYFRKKFHTRASHFTPDFAINNTKPLEPQVTRIAEKLESVKKFGPLAQW